MHPTLSYRLLEDARARIPHALDHHLSVPGVVPLLNEPHGLQPLILVSVSPQHFLRRG